MAEHVNITSDLVGKYNTALILEHKLSIKLDAKNGSLQDKLTYLKNNNRIMETLKRKSENFEEEIKNLDRLKEKINIQIHNTQRQVHDLEADKNMEKQQQSNENRKGRKKAKNMLLELFCSSIVIVREKENKYTELKRQYNALNNMKEEQVAVQLKHHIEEFEMQKSKSILLKEAFHRDIHIS